MKLVICCRRSVSSASASCVDEIQQLLVTDGGITPVRAIVNAYAECKNVKDRYHKAGKQALRGPLSIQLQYLIK
jgi:hypothetical protein